MDNGMVIKDEKTLLARMPVEQWEVRHSGRPDETFTVRGYAAVFDVLSHDMGGFRTRLASDSMDDVLATDPDVHFVWDHNTRYVGARTSNETLHLSADTTGLFIDAQVGSYTWAKDLRTALERGDVDQGSIAIEIEEDEWSVSDDEEIVRTIKKVGGLYDVTVTAQGAFPQTNMAVAYSLVRAAAADGRLPEAGAALVAQLEGEPPSQPGGEGSEVTKRAEELQHLVSVRRDELAKLRERADRL